MVPLIPWKRKTKSKEEEPDHLTGDALSPHCTSQEAAKPKHNSTCKTPRKKKVSNKEKPGEE